MAQSCDLGISSRRPLLRAKRHCPNYCALTLAFFLVPLSQANAEPAAVLVDEFGAQGGGW
jgi:hypothetical protein